MSDARDTESVLREGYEYENEGQAKLDDKHARKARELVRAGIKTEAMEEAGKVYHYERSCDLIDEVSRRAE